MKATSAFIKGTMGTEDEPFEGEVPLAKVEEFIAKHIKD